MGLIDEQQGLAGQDLQRVENGLDPAFELSPDTGPGLERPQVQCVDLHPHQRGRHTLLMNPPGKPFHERGLSGARLAKNHRVVLLAPAQDVDELGDFLFATHDRIKAPFGHILAEILAKLSQGIACGVVSPFCPGHLRSEGGGIRLAESCSGHTGFCAGRPIQRAPFRACQGLLQTGIFHQRLGMSGQAVQQCSRTHPFTLKLGSRVFRRDAQPLEKANGQYGRDAPGSRLTRCLPGQAPVEPAVGRQLLNRHGFIQCRRDKVLRAERLLTTLHAQSRCTLHDAQRFRVQLLHGRINTHVLLLEK